MIDQEHQRLREISFLLLSTPWWSYTYDIITVNTFVLDNIKWHCKVKPLYVVTTVNDSFFFSFTLVSNRLKAICNLSKLTINTVCNVIYIEMNFQFTKQLTFHNFKRYIYALHISSILFNVHTNIKILQIFMYK